MDLLFYGDAVLLHAIDECIRWSAGDELTNRETAAIPEALTMIWIRPYGPPETMTVDQEGALGSEEAAVWFDR